jgi:hypothetical protein
LIADDDDADDADDSDDADDDGDNKLANQPLIEPDGRDGFDALENDEVERESISFWT